MTKKILAATAVAAALSACQSAYPPPVQQSRSVSPQGFRLAQSHWTDVAKIRAEAQRLGGQVRAGQMTKVQAAQHLNRFRQNLVGRNSVDDSVYEIYLQAMVDSQRGTITAAQSKAMIEHALRGWQQRWPHLNNKPNNPAFTNWLLEFMGMQPLQ